MVKNNDIPNNMIKLWTRQHKDALKEFEAKGVFRAKKSYIKQKNDTISEYYLKLYDWYVQKAEQLVPRPEGATYPVWLSTTPELMLQPIEDTVIFEVEVDRRHAIITNFEKWGYVVNYWYVPLDKTDETKHNKELKKYGIADESSLIMGDTGNFYPLLKNKILKSWDRIFNVMDQDVGMTQATLWEIKKEWVVNITYK